MFGNTYQILVNIAIFRYAKQNTIITRYFSRCTQK